MAFLRGFIALAVLAAFALPAFAKDYYVGDGYGWTLNFDYKAWAKGKQFYVGDRLIFKYSEGYHNVLKVGDKDSFKNCEKPNGVTPITSGYDVIPLTTPGTKWYICGVANHCYRGMKLVIKVRAKKEEGYGYKHKAHYHKEKPY